MVQTKATLATIQQFATAYADATKSGSTDAYNASTDNLVGAVDKIGEQFTVEGGYDDRLKFMDGSNLPLGRTVEEYFRAIAQASLWEGSDKEGAKVNTPAFIPYEKCAYSYELGRVKFKSSTDGSQLAEAAVSSEVFGNIVANEMSEISDQKSIYKYNIKKSALRNIIDKARNATNKDNLVENTAVPSTAEEAEDFITAIKTQVKKFRFANEGNNLGNCLIGAIPNALKPKLIVKVGLLDTLDKLAKAGAFHDEYFDLSTWCDIEEVDDFAGDTKVIAMIIDPRMIKVKPYIDKTGSDYNLDGDFMSTVNHFGVTIVTSLYTALHVYSAE